TTTYAATGRYTITVQIADEGGATVTAQGDATVTSAPLNASGTRLSATEGLPFTGVVASFTGGAPAATARDFTATLQWDFEQPTPGMIAPNDRGGFDVLGTHTFREAGNHGVTIVVRAADGAAATAQSPVLVADGPINATGLPVTGHELQRTSGNVASFVDAEPGTSVGDYRATIDWGNGSISDGLISPD